MKYFNSLLCCFLTAILFNPSLLHAQSTILICDFTGTAPSANLPWTKTSVLDTHLTFNGWNLGAGMNKGRTDNSWNGPQVDNGLGLSLNARENPSTLADAITDNQYITFSLTPKPLSILNLNSSTVTFNVKLNSGHAPKNYSVFTSLKGFSSGNEVYTSQTLGQSTNVDQLITFNFPASGYDNIKTAVEIRVYLHNANYAFHTTSITGWTMTGVIQNAPADTEIPTSPTAVTASNISQSSFTLSWTSSTDNVGVSGYDVYANGTLKASVTGTTTFITGLSASTIYSMIVKAKDDAGNVSAPSTALNVTTSTAIPEGAMTTGTNFWNINWEPLSDYFASGVNWSTTSDPWNPKFISDLQQAKMKCLRFMDWNLTNDNSITEWSQRIPKTANHNNVDNKIPCFTNSWDAATNIHTLTPNAVYSFGVAYEWQIDLCNKVGADIWVNIPMAASDDYCYQLANLIKNQLSPSSKVYIEWANETWNWGFSTAAYAHQQGVALGLPITYVIDGKTYYNTAERAYTVYAAIRAFTQFERVFGTNSPRLVKVIAGQIGTYWNGHNNMIAPDLAALKNTTLNPNGIIANAWAGAPYISGQTIADERNSIATVNTWMDAAYKDLAASGLKLICYEGGADNYPDGNLALSRDPAQEQIYVDYLNTLSKYVQGAYAQYCFYGGCWGLKYAAGESEAINPKWKGWMDYWMNNSVTQIPEVSITNSNISVYPNPVSDLLNVQIDSHFTGRVNIELFDIMGKKMMQYQSIFNGNTLQLNVKNLITGLYTLKITAGSQILISKVMIKK